jgi:hypothetical protein
MSSTAPAGGAALVTLNLSSNGGSPTAGFNYPLPAPLVVASGQQIAISAVADMIQSVQVTVSGGTPSFTKGAIGPVVVFGSPSGVAAAQFYSSLGNTTASYDYTNPPVNGQTVRVYYSSAGVVAAVIFTPTSFFSADGGFTGFAYAANPADAPADGPNSEAGGFAGIDAGGDICWAQATSFAWTTYTDVYQLPEIATLGSSATIVREKVTTTPSPSSGNTYATGCPVLATDGSLTLTLAGH